jgi:hypothetical protein
LAACSAPGSCRKETKAALAAPILESLRAVEQYGNSVIGIIAAEQVKEYAQAAFLGEPVGKHP